MTPIHLHLLVTHLPIAGGRIRHTEVRPDAVQPSVQPGDKPDED